MSRSHKSEKLEQTDDFSLDEKRLNEAKSKGLTFISRATSRLYAYYKIDSCGHRDFFHFGAIRKMRGAAVCSTCVDEKIKEDAEKAGLIVHSRKIYHSNDSRLYTLKCGHSKIMKTGNVSRLKAELDSNLCEICKEVEYRKIAKDNLATKLTNGYTADFQLSCGHIKRTTIEDIGSGACKCRECQEDRYEEEAILAGIVMNRFETHSHYDYREYTLPCGCSKEIPIVSVRKLSFECKNHSARLLDFSGNIFVYLAKLSFSDGFTVLKFGFSAKPERRMKMLYLNSGEYSILDTLLFKNGEDALAFEKLIHSKHNSCKVDSNVLRHRMSNGYTECYPETMLETLTKEINTKRTNLHGEHA